MTLFYRHDKKLCVSRINQICSECSFLLQVLSDSTYCVCTADMHTIIFSQGKEPKKFEKLKYHSCSDLTCLRGNTGYFKMVQMVDCNTFKAHHSLQGLPTICNLTVIYQLLSRHLLINFDTDEFYINLNTSNLD